MKYLNHFIIGIIIVLVSFFLSFYFVYTDSFCLAQESFLLDQSAFEVLEGGANGQNGAYSESSTFGLNADPNTLVFGVNAIIDDINTKLYQNYGWDLETMSWVVEDSMSQAVKDQVNHNLALGATIGSGFMLYESSVVNALTGAKDYILGKVDETTGKISEVYNNAYTYLSDSFVNKFLGLKQDMIQNDEIVDISNPANCYFSKSVVFDRGNVKYILNFSSEKLFYCYGDGVSIVFPNDNAYWDFVGGLRVVGSSTEVLTGASLSNANTFYVNGREYVVGYIIVRPSGYTVACDLSFGSLENAKSLCYLFNNDTSYYYNSSNYNAIKNLLDQLKGTWVTTDDLRQINTKLDELTLGNISIDGQNNRVIETNTDSLTELSSLIESILEQNADISLALDELNNSSGGGSGSEDDDDFPTEFPSTFWPSFFPDLLPDEMFTMFKPIFDIVGTQYSMYGLWILIPSILIFILILYILVSLF